MLADWGYGLCILLTPDLMLWCDGQGAQSVVWRERWTSACDGDNFRDRRTYFSGGMKRDIGRVVQWTGNVLGVWFVGWGVLVWSGIVRGVE